MKRKFSLFGTELSRAALFAFLAFGCFSAAQAADQLLCLQFGKINASGTAVTEDHLPYMTAYSISREQMPQIIGVEPAKCDSTAVMKWFKDGNSSGTCPHYWAHLAEIEEKGVRWDVLPEFKKQLNNPKSKILTATNVIQAVDLASALTNESAWTVISYAKGDSVGLRLAYTTKANGQKYEYEGQTVGLITGATSDFNDWTHKIANRFKITAPANTTLLSVTNAAGKVFVPGVDGEYGVDNGEVIYITCAANDGYMFLDNTTEATATYTVDAKDVTPALPMVVTYSPLPLDKGDGTTYAAGNYLVLDLATGDRKFYPNATEEQALEFTNDVYKTTKMVFRKIPAGRFVTHEASPKEVRMEEDYWLAIYQTTFSQYSNVVESVSAYEAVTDAANLMKPQYRVTRDSLIKADVGLVPKMNAKFTDFTTALPTSDQLERGSAAGSTTPLYFTGDVDQYAVANLTFTSDNTRLFKALTVGSKLPNGWGFYDTVGNAWEWTDTPHTTAGYYYVRGGSWGSGVKVSSYMPKSYLSGTGAFASTTGQKHLINHVGVRLVLSNVKVPVEGAKDSEGNPVQVRVEDKWASKYGLTYDQVTNTVDNAPNGRKVWENYVLGLDPTDAASCPLLSIVQTEDPDSIDLSVTGIAPKADAGVDVLYSLWAGASPTSGFSQQGEETALPAFSVGLPSGSEQNQVKYFRVRTSFHRAK